MSVHPYAVPQQLFKDKFLPQAIANDLALDDKQVAQVNDFVWRWRLFPSTLTIQKPTSPDGRPITPKDLENASVADRSGARLIRCGAGCYGFGPTSTPV